MGDVVLTKRQHLHPITTSSTHTSVTTPTIITSDTTVAATKAKATTINFTATAITATTITAGITAAKAKSITAENLGNIELNRRNYNPTSCISNSSGTVNDIKLKLSVYVERDIEETKCAMRILLP